MLRLQKSTAENLQHRLWYVKNFWHDIKDNSILFILFFNLFLEVIGIQESFFWEDAHTHVHACSHIHTNVYTHIHMHVHTCNSYNEHTYTHVHMYVYDLFIISGYSQAPWNSLRKPILRTSNQIPEESEIHRIYTTCQKLKYMLKTPWLLLHPLFSSVPSKPRLLSQKSKAINKILSELLPNNWRNPSS